MTDGTYASWVEPIAAGFREHRTRLADVVRAIPQDAWVKPSPNEGWTYRDLLGHVSTRDPRDFRIVLNAVITKTRLDPAQLPLEEETPINQSLLDEIRALTVEEVAGRLEGDTDELLGLLSQLSEEDENLRQGDFPLSLSEALRQMPNHEQMHLDQLRTALEG